MSTRIATLAVSLSLSMAVTASAQPPTPGAKVTPLLTKPLAGIDGKEGLMVVVEYPPGVASAAHRHNANTFVYVLEGSVVMQVAGGQEMTLTPSDVHTVSRNASDSKAAKILVLLVKDVGAPVTLPAN